MKPFEHMRYEQYIEFIASKGLMRHATGAQLDFGFLVWLKTVEQSENIVMQTEACTDVHQCG